jgi:hypothetical protein
MLTQMVWQWWQQFRDERTSVLNDTKPHMAARTVKHTSIATFSWERLDHVPYSPNLSSSDLHFFPTMKGTFEGCRFTTNEDAEAFVRNQDNDIYQQGFFKLVKCWDKCINVGEDHDEKQPTKALFCPHRCASRPCHFRQMVD